MRSSCWVVVRVLMSLYHILVQYCTIGWMNAKPELTYEEQMRRLNKIRRRTLSVSFVFMLITVGLNLWTLHNSHKRLQAEQERLRLTKELAHRFIESPCNQFKGVPPKSKERDGI